MHIFCSIIGARRDKVPLLTVFYGVSEKKRLTVAEFPDFRLSELPPFTAECRPLLTDGRPQTLRGTAVHFHWFDESRSKVGADRKSHELRGGRPRAMRGDTSPRLDFQLDVCSPSSDCSGVPMNECLSEGGECTEPHGFWVRYSDFLGLHHLSRAGRTLMQRNVPQSPGSEF